MLSEDLSTSLCYDHETCRHYYSNNPNLIYNTNKLKIPTISEIERQLTMTYWERFKEWIKLEAGMLSFIVLLYNILMSILLLIDLCTNDNQNNLIRFTVNLIWKLVIKLATCCSNKKLKTHSPNRNTYNRNIEMQTFQLE